MKRRIEKYRRAPVDVNVHIGCILLRQPSSFQEADWIPAPADFARNIVQGNNYVDGSAQALWARLSHPPPDRSFSLPSTTYTPPSVSYPS